MDRGEMFEAAVMHFRIVMLLLSAYGCFKIVLLCWVIATLSAIYTNYHLQCIHSGHGHSHTMIMYNNQ